MFDDYLQYTKEKIENIDIFQHYRIIIFTNINNSIDFLQNFDNIEEIYIRGIKTLFNYSLYKLPRNLKILHINNHNFFKSLDNLPNTLEELQIHHCHYPFDLTNLPKSLKKLILYNCVGKIIFPENLEELYIYWKFRGKLIFPKNLKILYLRFDINEELNLPQNLQEIYIHKKYPYIHKLKNIKVNLL